MMPMPLYALGSFGDYPDKRPSGIIDRTSWVFVSPNEHLTLGSTNSHSILLDERPKRTIAERVMVHF